MAEPTLVVAVGESSVILIDTSFLSVLKHLINVEGGAAEWQSRRRLPG